MAFPALLPAQRRLLRALQSTGTCTDASAAAFLTDMGAPCDRSLVVRWRAEGEQARPMPVGALRPMLVHVADPHAVASVLRVLADGLGVEVSVAGEQQAPSMADAAAGLQMAMAQATMALLQATSASSPGGTKIDRSEAAAINEQLDELDRCVQALRKAAEGACL